jgi:hypothetical protein
MYQCGGSRRPGCTTRRQPDRSWVTSALSREFLYMRDGWRHEEAMATSTDGVHINDEDRATLVSWTRSSSVRAGVATRAKIVLAAGDGEGTSSISRRLGVSRPTVIHWRERCGGGSGRAR